MSKKQRKLNFGGTIFIKLEDLRDFYVTFRSNREISSICSLDFSTKGIIDVDIMGVNWETHTLEDFTLCDKFLSQYDSFGNIKKTDLTDFGYTHVCPVILDDLQQLREEILALRKSGKFRNCIIFYTIGSDFSHAHVHFYSHSKKQLLSFHQFINSSSYVYCE